MNYANLIDPNLAYLFLSVVFIVLVCFFQSLMVAKARIKYQVQAPATTGNLDFERVFRAHYNTLEQLPIALTLLVVFGLTYDIKIATWLGFLWGIARLAYAFGYAKSSKDRSLGSYTSSFILLILLIGSLYGIINIIY